MDADTLNKGIGLGLLAVVCPAFLIGVVIPLIKYWFGSNDPKPDKNERK